MNSVRQIVTLAVLGSLSGCIPIPLPTHASKARYSETQLASVGKEAQTREEIRARLGAPDLEMADGRAWIYAWEVGHGKIFAIPLLPLAAGDLGPIKSDQFLLVLEFDRDGSLQSKGFAAKDKGTGRYCTSEGVCIEHDVEIGTDANRNGLVLTGFRKYDSAVTVRGSAKERFPGPAVQAAECLLTIWPDVEWSRRGYGVKIDVVPGLSEHHGIPQTSNPALVRWWLPSESYARFALSGGDYSVIGDDGVKISAADFSCPTGSRVYLAIGRAAEATQEHLIVLRHIEEDQAKAAISGMSRLILD